MPVKIGQRHIATVNLDYLADSDDISHEMENVVLYINAQCGNFGSIGW